MLSSLPSMKTTVQVIIISVLYVTTLSGCAEEIGNTGEEVRTIAEPTLDNILDGMKNNNYLQYSKKFNHEMKKRVPEERFLAINKEIQGWIGDYLSREYTGFKNRSGSTLITWDSRFSKSEEPVAIKLVITKRYGMYMVNGLWFMVPDKSSGQ